MPDELFFLAGDLGAAAGAAFGALVEEKEEVEADPREGTGGITNLETSTVFALRFRTFLVERFALFFTALFAVFLTARFAVRFAGRFAATRLAGRFFAAAFFFVATITP